MRSRNFLIASGFNGILALSAVALENSIAVGIFLGLALLSFVSSTDKRIK